MEGPVCLDCGKQFIPKDNADKEGYWYTGRCEDCRNKEEENDEPGI
uniref:Uncharacterized protein n=1 Tax=viral metagenome TaxID=1070528 RepID=A0A6M3JZ10_9ZZZZ